MGLDRRPHTLREGSNPAERQMRSNPKREFIRHTVHVPIEVRSVEGTVEEESVNLSHGGLAFCSESCPEEGEVIEVSIPTVDPPFTARGRVAWCRREGDGYLVGVAFLDASDLFRARMVQQVCTIEQYRREVESLEGRHLSTAEAAEEWITRFAGRFPDAEPSYG
jgi:hypothetical protein